MSLYAFESDSVEERERAFTELALGLMDRNDPNRLMAEVEASVTPIAEVDPGTANAAAMTIGNGHQYLVANLPPIQFDPLFPRTPVALPSQGEIDAFLRRVAALDDPYSVMDRFLDGTLDDEEVEAVQTVYPDLYGTMIMDMLEVLTESGGPAQVPYEARLHMSTMFGVPTDQSFTAEYTLSVMNQGAQTRSQQEAQFSPSSLPQGPMQTVTTTKTQEQRLSDGS